MNQDVSIFLGRDSDNGIFWKEVYSLKNLPFEIAIADAIREVKWIAENRAQYLKPVLAYIQVGGGMHARIKFTDSDYDYWDAVPVSSL